MHTTLKEFIDRNGGNGGKWEWDMYVEHTFVSFLDIPADQIAAFARFKPEQKLEKNGDSYTLTTIMPDQTKVLTFKNGVEFDEEVTAGRIAKTTFTFDGNTLTQVQKHTDGNVITQKREYFDDKLIVTLTRTNWDGIARRYYKV
ncbi:unnamed protein product [Parnassius apollo]|uniref:(apollo) hypothetical protein n=1 Tax=Parnassius apollo TaxID=110799 RepID=A0A8S3XFN6_PARAO|nr:unnamed protein product [Parnassius apollo]